MTGENVEVHYHEEIYRLMTSDALTQIFNRRYFNEALERELNRSRRYERELSLVLFDIDFFKRINDTHGHLAGDGILRQVSSALKQKLRREDIFARTGGEEFGVILPEIGLAGARITAEKCRRTIESTAMGHDGKVIPVTISVGVATLQGQTTPEELYKTADDQLYAAKQSGRNRVCG
jgi:diguanylate cyclase (GGDEF)-like protein